MSTRTASQARRSTLVRAAEQAAEEGVTGSVAAARVGLSWKKLREQLKAAGRMDLVLAIGPTGRGPIDPEFAAEQKRQRIERLVEDVEWMLTGYESLTGAAHRFKAAGNPIGRTPAGIAAALHRAERNDLVQALRANEPLSLYVPGQRRGND